MEHINYLIRKSSQIFGSFAKLRKATISFVNVCLFFLPSARMEQLDSHWQDFQES